METYLSSHRGFARGLAAVALAAAGVASLFGAEQTTADPIVELPKFVVTDSRALPEPESWRYAELPGFEVLSSASPRATKRLVSDFQMFRDAVDAVWPTPSKVNAPVLLIICGKHSQFQAFEKGAEDGTAVMGHASMYLKGRNQSAIIINMGSSLVDVTSLDMDIDSMQGVDSTRIFVDHNKQLYREYVKFLLSKSEPRFPPWFEEGMAQIFMRMQFNPKWIEFAKLEEATVSAQAAANAQIAALGGGGGESDGTSSFSGSEPAEDRDFPQALGRRALMPMDKLFAVTRESPEAKNPLGSNVWAKQSYAFVHMGLYGYNGKYQKAFTEFLLRCTQQTPTEEMFKECFARRDSKGRVTTMSYKDMLLELRGYAQVPDYKAFIVKPTNGGTFLREQPVNLRDATPSEVGRIKGRAMLLAGQQDKARTELIAPYMRGDRDPQLLAALGQIEHIAGKDDRARQFLAAAVDKKTTDPEAYIDLARLQLADAKAKPAGPDKQLSAAQATAITTLLRTARKLPPPNASTYELLAETLAQSSERPQREEVQILVEGVQVFPNRLKLAFLTASLAVDAGMPEVAHILADHGLKYAPDAPTKAKFQQLKSSLPPAPVATPAAAPAAPAKSGGR